MKNKPKLFNKDHQKVWSKEYQYKHIHTGEYCKFESYVAEYLILRREDAFKKPKPSYKFWTKGDKLYPAFIRQLKSVIKLRKRFSEEVILGAINSHYFNNIFFTGLYAKNYVGWKMNPLALEAVESYDKERIAKEKIQQKAKENENCEIKIDREKVVTRKTQSYKQKHMNFKKLRDL